MGERAPEPRDPPVDEIEIFATGSTVLRVDPPLVELAADRHHPPDGRGYRARPGHRPGVPRPDDAMSANEVAGGRRGDSADIVRPMFVPPDLAVSLIEQGSVVADIRHLRSRVDDHAAPGWLTWPVTLVIGRRRTVAATLHLRASPSMVVTVLELIPTRRLRTGRRRFVRRGVAAIETLATHIEQLALTR